MEFRVPPEAANRSAGAVFDFSGQVVVITGGGGGIGRAAAHAFAGAGADIVVVDISRESGEQTLGSLRERGGRGVFVHADVSRSEDVSGYVRKAVDQFGRIDVFINNAAWEGEVRDLVDYPEEVFDKVIGVNVRGVFLGLKHVLPVMYAQKQGAVVNTSSLAGYVGSHGLVAYTASKHAVLGMTKTAAIEGAKLGVRVNAVCPGAVDTPMLHSLARAKGPGEFASAMQKYASDAPDGRLARPEEIANVMLFLASDLSSHISGQGFRIDGGRITY